MRAPEAYDPHPYDALVDGLAARCAARIGAQEPVTKRPIVESDELRFARSALARADAGMAQEDADGVRLAALDAMVESVVFLAADRTEDLEELSSHYGRLLGRSVAHIEIVAALRHALRTASIAREHLSRADAQLLRKFCSADSA